jgi:hypothetical protein
MQSTLVDWYSRKQATVKTAAFGSEFTAASIAVDHIIDLRTNLRYIGVPVREKSYMLETIKLSSQTVPYLIHHCARGTMH